MPTSRPSSSTQRGAAPFRMRRRGEQRLVEQVFPVAGELAAWRRPRPSARARGRRGRSRTTSSPTSTPRAEPRASGARPARRAAAPARSRSRSRRRADARPPRGRRGGEPDRLGLGDQVADGEDEAVVADDDAVAGALGTEDRRGEGIFRNARLQSHDGVERALQIEFNVRRIGLQRRREGPVSWFGHRHFDRTGTGGVQCEPFYAIARTVLPCRRHGRTTTRDPESRRWTGDVFAR